jgi:hypothetical protein
MEKRNVIEQGRTPDFDKQSDMDAVEKAATAQFDAPKPKCTRCEQSRLSRAAALQMAAALPLRRP